MKVVDNKDLVTAEHEKKESSSQRKVKRSVDLKHDRPRSKQAFDSFTTTA